MPSSRHFTILMPKVICAAGAIQDSNKSSSIVRFKKIFQYSFACSHSSASVDCELKLFFLILKSQHPDLLVVNL
jgi:hypothetical protein